MWIRWWRSSAARATPYNFFPPAPNPGAGGLQCAYGHSPAGSIGVYLSATVGMGLAPDLCVSRGRRRFVSNKCWANSFYLTVFPIDTLYQCGFADGWSKPHPYSWCVGEITICLLLGNMAVCVYNGYRCRSGVEKHLEICHKDFPPPLGEGCEKLQNWAIPAKSC